MTEKPSPRVVHRPPPPGAEAGIDEAMIHRLVHGFYDRIRVDPELGPIFAREIDDWDPHLAKMCDFWSSVVLMTKRYDEILGARKEPLAAGSPLQDQLLPDGHRSQQSPLRQSGTPIR